MPRPAVEEVLERLINDKDFRESLAKDPDSVLTAYDLTEQELESLVNQLSSATGATRHVEARTSKSALIQILDSLIEPGGEGTPDSSLESPSPDASPGDPDQPIITGRVYNAEQEGMDPSAVIESPRAPQGGGVNEMVMDDTPGKEIPPPSSSDATKVSDDFQIED